MSRDPEPLGEVRLLQKVVQVLYWRVSIEEPTFVASTNWHKEYLNFRLPVSQKDLETVCHASNAALKTLGSKLRVDCMSGEIRKGVSDG